MWTKMAPSVSVLCNHGSTFNYTRKRNVNRSEWLSVVIKSTQKIYVYLDKIIWQEKIMYLRFLPIISKYIFLSFQIFLYSLFTFFLLNFRSHRFIHQQVRISCVSDFSNISLQHFIIANWYIYNIEAYLSDFTLNFVLSMYTTMIYILIYLFTLIRLISFYLI